MTVVLAGVGADTTNVGTVAPLYDDGRFEYVPIPEKTRETDEEETFGSWPLRGRKGVAADLTTRIRPRPIGDDDLVLSGEDLAGWPLHRDPNFEALSYGEHRAGYVSRLRSLEAGDAVGFYAGLSDGDRTHRYLIGSFTVEEVAVVTPETPPEEREAILERFPENAHAKRASGTELYREEKAVVLLAGREPGGLLARDPVRISDYYVAAGNERAQYYLRERVSEKLSVVAGRENMTFKPAYECSIPAERFHELLGEPGDRPVDEPA
ncbi:hypothetical protein [Saliphagus infecundisoli]|uniref:Nucleotide modification associated domain-containing protein n=1 Tax=Saliphagus infecundisoli TaxID=1849069 RepID=A0ABD5QB44_9EURY|nr:hypothetical protein [Saliphagus infecundisoli]